MHIIIIIICWMLASIFWHTKKCNPFQKILTLAVTLQLFLFECVETLDAIDILLLVHLNFYTGKSI